MLLALLGAASGHPVYNQESCSKREVEPGKYEKREAEPVLYLDQRFKNSYYDFL